MNISNEIQEKAKKLATNGETAEQVLARALSILAQVQDEEENLRQAVAIGFDELDRGEGIPGEQVFAELKEKYPTR